MIEIEIDSNSGFCFGVVRAIQRAEQELEKGELYSIGDIVHNRIEVSRLQNKGLKVITTDSLNQLEGKRVYIRAHGEPPSTFNKCKELNINVIDATCPVVYKLQQTVKEGDKTLQEVGGQVVILGKNKHPEVIGLNGQINNRGIIVEGLSDLDLIDFKRPIFLISQTTKPLELFKRVAKEVEDRFQIDKKFLTIKDTICRNVSNRENHLAQFSTKHSLIIFVSGRESSNGKALYEVCLRNNPNCYKVEDEGEVKDEWLENINSIGICGATSTPLWLMKQVAEEINKRVNK